MDRPAGERLHNAYIIVNFDLILAVLSSKRVRQIKNRHPEVQYIAAWSIAQYSNIGRLLAIEGGYESYSATWGYPDNFLFLLSVLARLKKKDNIFLELRFST